MGVDVGGVATLFSIRCDSKEHAGSPSHSLALAHNNNKKKEKQKRKRNKGRRGCLSERAPAASQTTPTSSSSCKLQPHPERKHPPPPRAQAQPGEPSDGALHVAFLKLRDRPSPRSQRSTVARGSSSSSSCSRKPRRRKEAWRRRGDAVRRGLTPLSGQPSRRRHGKRGKVREAQRKRM